MAYFYIFAFTTFFWSEFIMNNIYFNVQTTSFYYWNKYFIKYGT